VFELIVPFIIARSSALPAYRLNVVFDQGRWNVFWAKNVPCRALLWRKI